MSSIQTNIDEILIPLVWKENILLYTSYLKDFTMKNFMAIFWEMG